MTSVTVRLSDVRRRIAEAAGRCGRRADSICLVAVSKTQPVALIREAAATGQRHFGENYVQDAVAKIDALADLQIVWHFIGHIQSNKSRALAERFGWVHTIDRERIARRLNEYRPPDGPPLNVCLQVRVGGESARAGVEPVALEDLARTVVELPRLRLRGLMCLPPRETDPQRQRVYFRELRGLYLSLRESGLDLDTLSMGMTGDLEAAIIEGATHVRVGTAIFGPRVS